MRGEPLCSLSSTGESKGLFMDIIKFGLKYWKKYLPSAIFCQLMGFIVILIGLLLPQLNQLIIDYVINYDASAVVESNNVFQFLVDGTHGQPGTLSLFMTIALVFGSMLILREIMLYFRNNIFVRCGIWMECRLREDSYRKLMQQSSTVLSRYSAGDLLTTLHHDIVNFKELFSRSVMLILDAVYMMIITVVLLANVSWYLAIIPLVLSPLLAFTLRAFMKNAREISVAIRDRRADMNMVVQENVNATRIVRSFANEEQENAKFDERNEEIKQIFFKHADFISRYTVYFNVIRQVAYVTSIAVGAFLIFSNKISIGALVAFTGYVLTLMDCVTQLNNSLFAVQQYIVSGGRLMVFMKTGNIIDNPANPLPIEKEPHLHLENVSLMMDDQQVLSHIELDIPYGKKVGIMGGTGSGKTVLLKALTRMYDVTEGSITINGRDIREYDLESVRRQFSFVFQDVFLFSNTVDANIAFYNPDESEDRILEVSRQAMADEFITGLPEGYQTIIGEKGLGLSGGQKQRLSIARALAKNAPVLVLDDATSALDMKTEKALLACIKENYSDRTLLISAHRASSVAACDEIIYLQDGKIVERGTFDQLMAQGGIFAQIYRKQNILYAQTNSATEHSSR